MNKSAIDNISHEEFERAIQEHITWASEWDGALPADVFFGLWADLHREKQTLELKAHLIEGRLEITAPPESPVKVVDNRIYLEDGLELIINLE
jgi:hypothetical protein